MARKEQTESVEDMASALAMSQFELALVVAKNAFEQWVSRCGAAAGAPGYSPLEMLVLHMVDHKGRPKRISDISFALKIEDNHTVAYALKKLTKAGLVSSERIGKETIYATAPEGRDLVERYRAVRQRCLIQSLTIFDNEALDLVALSDLLRALSGHYEQAARSAETAI